MFHQMITKQRDAWLASSACTATELLRYMEGRGFLRDAQLEAIKTYLFLKIGCGSRPLWQLFTSGAFTSLDVDELELRDSVRQQLRADAAALALYEYALQRDDRGEQAAPGVEKLLRGGAPDMDFSQVFRDFFRVPYPDYLFSLPMGAGKTYLMAAFIYLDLYFAQAEPENRAFAHNFIIFAPSGLKSSVVPSLRTIQNFDPAWIIPEPAASGLKRLLKFEVLDQQRSARRSNRAKNPNVRKVAAYQPFDDLMGLVLVANAEKVIYDRLDEEERQLSLFPREEQAQIRQAAELRQMIGCLPSLAVYVDEVHHAADREIKLRRVIDHWTERRVDGLPTVTGVVGFSGTPYLDTAPPVPVGPVVLKSAELANVVYHYPLARGIGNFLKRPLLYVSDNPDRISIVAAGVRGFLEQYGDKVYPGGLTAKLAVYCGQIAPLEEEVLPLVNGIVAEYGMDPNEVVLKYYGKNSDGTYVCPPENATAFAALDTPLSKKRIILLAQIGKEGWDCRSLTGVILSQKGDCPTNMVLQTACRCLRQVEKGAPETAGIWLNQFNAAKLEAQLQKEQHISLREFSAPPARTVRSVHRYDRTDSLALPVLDFYQLRVRYSGEAVDRGRDVRTEILAAPEGLLSAPVTQVRDLSGNVYEIRPDESGAGDPVTYPQWLYLICKESFPVAGNCPITLPRLAAYDGELRAVFRRITEERDGVSRYLPDCHQTLVRSRIRAALGERVRLKNDRGAGTDTCQAAAAGEADLPCAHGG